MAKTLYEIYELFGFRTTTMQARTETAIAQWVDLVLYEDPATANHTNRVTLAQKLMTDVNRQKAAQMMTPFFGVNTDFQNAGEAGFTDAQWLWLVHTHVFDNAAAVSGFLAALT